MKVFSVFVLLAVCFFGTSFAADVCKCGCCYPPQSNITCTATDVGVIEVSTCTAPCNQQCLYSYPHLCPAPGFGGTINAFAECGESAPSCTGWAGVYRFPDTCSCAAGCCWVGEFTISLSGLAGTVNGNFFCGANNTTPRTSSFTLASCQATGATFTAEGNVAGSMKNWIVSKDALTLRIVEGVAGSVNPSKIQCQDVGTCESGVCTQGSASTLPINLGALLLAVLVALAL